MSAKSVKSALEDLTFTSEKSRLSLCKEHYREYKKATKEDRKLDSLGWS